MELRKYRITGVVQGVGFRPFIHKLCDQLNLTGWIQNDSEGVLLELEGESISIENVINKLKIEPPLLSRIDEITKIYSKEISSRKYMSFIIKSSVKGNSVNTLIPPDSYVCDDCIKELFDKKDRRYRYPFINCTNCGPRYSIIEEMPYDRNNTTMRKFKMCNSCFKEYNEIFDRRYHAQPVACPVCGPKIEIYDNKGNIQKNSDDIEFCKEQLKKGSIIAVKSVGGFHLAIDAKNEMAIDLLRKKKMRDKKPFALMVRDIKTAEKIAQLSDLEKKILSSPERPIVLVKKKKDVLPEAISPNNSKFGIMLPSAPLHYLLLEDADLSVLIMTSGNISHNPVIYQNEMAKSQLNDIADYFIINDRDICTGIDDSIVKCLYLDEFNEEIVSIVRRARGFAPYPIKTNNITSNILASGAELKATISLSKDNEVYMSQHIGDLKSDASFNSALKIISQMERLLSISPECVACDMHPNFRTTIYWQENGKYPVKLVQHHHAHMASCMAENGLEKNVIGVIFDGTGYGTDGTIWGGEFLIGNYITFERAAHIESFFLNGGDKAVKEPFRIALDLLYRAYGLDSYDLDFELINKFSKEELNVYFKMSEFGINSFESTSIGRMFDGISALIGLCYSITYEAQAAIMLEDLLGNNMTLTIPYHYKICNDNNSLVFDYKLMIKEIVDDLIKYKIPKEEISRKFHSTIVIMTIEICLMLKAKSGINDVVLSGGVFMNDFLLYNIISELRKKSFNVYYHSTVPTNDGGISLGQIAVANALLKKNNTKEKYNE